jgi:hypothetical protein
VAPEESPTPIPKAKRTGFRWRRWLVGVLAGLVLLAAALALAFRFFGYDMAKAWLESPAGARVAGTELGKAIKVDGKFAPLHLNGWNIQTDSFTSTGWPGEAIGSLDCNNIRVQFDPSAFWRHAWRVSGIQIDRAVIRLVKPNDALKRPVPPKKPRPWYAFLFPDHFECGPIVSQDSDIDFYFQGVDAGIHHAHVQADLIGRDLKYTATSGVLDFPYLPPLQVHRLEMLVTRPSITIYTAQMAGIDPADPAHLTLSGRMGMREDKSIDAKADVTEMSIEQVLPENLRPLIHGKISGRLTWHRNASGSDVFSEGDLKLTDAGIDNLSIFKAVADLNDNPDLHDFPFSDASCHYRLQNDVISLQLNARSPGKFHVTGTVVYHLKTKMTDLDLVFDELPLKIWLPNGFKPRYSGVARATMQWHGRLDTKKDSTATLAIDLDGTHISDPSLLRHLLEKKGLRTPDEIQFDQARFNFIYQDQIFKLTGAQLVAPGVLSAQLTGSLAPGSALVATMDWQGLIVQDWLPVNLAQQFSGDLSGHATLAVRKWKFGDGSYGGDMRLMNGEVQYTPAQSLLARFLNRRELLKVPLTRLQLSWALGDRDLSVQGIDIRAGDDFGMQGDLKESDAEGLTGGLWIGTKPDYLRWLPDAEKTIFTRNDEGLVWARVNVSGTLKKPRQDLGTQVIAQLKRHPLALLGLGGKLVSWYVGNWFGAQKDWERPQTPSVEVGAPAKIR